MPNGVALSFRDMCALQYKELVYGSFQKQEYFLLFLCIFDLPSPPASIPPKYGSIVFSAGCVFSWFSLRTAANHKKQIWEKKNFDSEVRLME